ncbi:Shikimate kinase [Solidesulfovibrio fructosivorans JJ]]|uniref:Shikimate kinase n=1 Tax=Solidesulfovibrio fructosivorans JJ] TaxID=596151 RepID=E1K065_SOLFR|nr:shikimate kinase [Solidesulfovibrio fructosivorans]EFL49983.1 Shikimate kinase [Solidesulfovibrio fructosivorans JJ]]
MPLADDRNIYLIGPRASGKTTLGKRLAERLERPFTDLDAAFCEKYGETIADMVGRDGWDAFRKAEAAILAETAGQTGQVVATGGGVVLLPENRDLLGKGLVFYLQADPERLAERLMADLNEEQRPKLTQLGLREEITATLAEREPLYLACAHASLPERPVDELLEFALRALTAWERE